MLHQPTIDKLVTMRLDAMVDAWRKLEASEQADTLTFEDKLSLMVDNLWTSRQNLALQQRLRRAKLRGDACVEEIDYRAARGLDRMVVKTLAADSSWVQRHENIFLTGPTGVGKSYLANALGQKACRDGYTVLYTRASSLFRDLAMARADGSLRNLLVRLSRIDVLLIDDWVMAPLSEQERREFWEICEDRYQARSTVLTSQVPLAQWHAQIGDPSAADSILDRLVHNAHRIELKGESLRKTKGRLQPQTER